MIGNRRTEILDAARDAFASRGYGATSMSDLRRATGASTGSLYHHFPSKEHLAAALWVGALTGFQDGFAGAVEASGGAKEGVRDGVRFHLGWVTEHDSDARLLLAELEPAVAAVARDRLREANRAFFDRMRRWIGAAVRRGELRDLGVDLTYALWLGPAQEYARAWLEARVRPRPTQVADQLADGAWRALREEATPR